MFAKRVKVSELADLKKNLKSLVSNSVAVYPTLKKKFKIHLVKQLVLAAAAAVVVVVVVVVVDIVD